MKIVADCDGVFSDFVGAVCKRLTAAGYPRRPHEIKTERIDSTVSAPERDLITKLSHEEGFCASLPWYPGARLFLSTLQDLGQVVVMTAPWHGKTWAAERREWLASHVHKNDVWSVPSVGKPLAAAFADVLIEDMPRTCVEWVARTGRRAVLIDRPWNQGPDLPGVIRVLGFGQAARAVQSIVNGVEYQEAS